MDVEVTLQNTSHSVRSMQLCLFLEAADGVDFSWGGWAVPAANHVRPVVRVCNHPTALRNLVILKEGDPMSKSLQSEHGDSSSQSTVAVTPGDKSVAFNAQGGLCRPMFWPNMARTVCSP